MSDDEIVIEREIIVENKYGIHARPAALFVKTASNFECDIIVKKGNDEVSGKSIMGLMTLEAGPDTKLKIIATGDDSEEAIAELEKLFKNKFYED
jgi:phosphocarrier protein HPr